MLPFLLLSSSIRSTFLRAHATGIKARFLRVIPSDYPFSTVLYLFACRRTNRVAQTKIEINKYMCTCWTSCAPYMICRTVQYILGYTVFLYFFLLRQGEPLPRYIYTYVSLASPCSRYTYTQRHYQYRWSRTRASPSQQSFPPPPAHCCTHGSRQRANVSKPQK